MRLVNYHILNYIQKLRYTRFKEVLDLIFECNKKFVIIKKDFKNVFWNIYIAF